MTDKFGRNTSNIRRLAVKAEIARVRKGDFVKSLKAEGPSSKTMKKMAKSSTHSGVSMRSTARVGLVVPVASR